jgi:hypothetical protein
VDSPRLKIYVAGPYTAPTPELCRANVDKAIDAGLSLWKKGHFPYIPHLTHYIDEFAMQTGVPMSYEEYLEMDTAWLKECDALLYLGSSKGADYELENAKGLGLIIFHSIDEVHNCSAHIVS